MKPSVSDLQGELKHIRLTVLGLRLLRQEIRKSNVFTLRSECLLELSETPPKECRLSDFYRTKIVVLTGVPVHPRDSGLSAEGLEE